MEKQEPMYSKLRHYVDERGISHKLMAINMGISESRLSYMLNGGRRMTVDDFISACKAIAVSPKIFFD